MAKIIINGTEVESSAGVPVLQAALDMGLDIPHYCYHPGLSVVASCRLCLMEMKMPHPKTGELGWAPKLMPSCQTPVRDGMEVRFNSEAVKQNQRNCMEFYLLNHPLDCPVCDKAGECSLQDYSYRFGDSTSRMVDEKHVNPKKDLGPRTLLYADRCVMCSRCVRFTDEISGSGELCITNRGSKAEIDVFPGKVLDNPLQGNVVDLCPVGCLLDKDFLFKQRVWHLQGGDSICIGCATGCAIRIDQNENTIYRVKPRYNPGVNDWWICDHGRFGWGHAQDARRLVAPRIRRQESVTPLDWSAAPQLIRFRFGEVAAERGADQIAIVLSPFVACEEAWMLVSSLRKIAPEATLVLGPVPLEATDQQFPAGATNGDTKFTISKERCPNRRGIERIIEAAGGPTADFAEFCERGAKGEFAGAWISGGYPQEWVDKDLAKAAEKIEFVVLHDLFPSKLCDTAEVIIPACAFSERAGSFMNISGKVQPFEAAVRPPDGCKRDGQFFGDLAERTGLYRPKDVHADMAKTMPEFANVAPPPPAPKHQH
jgi:NADH-quinone oxidoreductase subunit G